MKPFSCTPDEWEDCGILGEAPIEIDSWIDTKVGCPLTQESVNICRVFALLDIYGPVRVEITKRVVTSRADLIRLEAVVLKEYLAKHGLEEESA